MKSEILLFLSETDDRDATLQGAGSSKGCSWLPSASTERGRPHWGTRIFL